MKKLLLILTMLTAGFCNRGGQGLLPRTTVEANNALREALDGDPTQWASAIDAFKASRHWQRCVEVLL